MKTTIPLALIAVALLCPAAAIPNAQAVSPPPDGGYPNFNTAEGQNALFSLTAGAGNTAVGWYSLFSDAEGSFNTATGAGALLFNTGDQNTAFGATALLFNSAGNFNTAAGVNALSHNTEGVSNSAFGWGALLSNETGTNNTAVGVRAGQNITGDSNICIGSQVLGVGGENNTIRIGDNLPNGSTCFIGGIFQSPVVGGDTVRCNSDGKVGTGIASKLFKEAIKPMDRASEVLLALTPVTFRYKKELDPTGTPQFGLVAEDVEKVNPDLVVHNKDGKPHSVRYDQISAMLLNEFLKEHRKNQQQEATIAKLQKELADLTATVKAQAAQIEKVSAQVEASKSVPRVVLNNP